MNIFKIKLRDSHTEQTERKTTCRLAERNKYRAEQVFMRKSFLLAIFNLIGNFSLHFDRTYPVKGSARGYMPRALFCLLFRLSSCSFSLTLQDYPKVLWEACRRIACNIPQFRPLPRSNAPYPP